MQRKKRKRRKRWALYLATFFEISFGFRKSNNNWLEMTSAMKSPRLILYENSCYMLELRLKQEKSKKVGLGALLD